MEFMKKPTLVDLFCGAGGLSHGFHEAGFQISAGVDFDADSLVSFRSNHPRAEGIKADLSQMEPQQLAEAISIGRDQLDCLCGGPPCQGFSRNRAFRHHEGAFVDDPRNHLYWHFFHFVEYFRPRIVVMENVPEILIKSNGFFRDAVFERFARIGYNVQAKILNAAEFGAPQQRRRAFFIAGRENQAVDFPSPTTLLGPRAGRRTPSSAEYIGKHEKALSLFDSLPTSPTVWDAIGDLHGQYADSLDGGCEYATEPLNDYQREWRKGCSRLWNHFPWPLTERQFKRISLLAQGQGQSHLPSELQTKNGYGSAYRRLQGNAQALTITTWMFHPGSGMFTHPLENRVITVREAARLQSFQDSFVFHGRYHSQCRQVGNSVAPLVAKNVAQAVLRSLDYKPAGDASSTRILPARAKSSMASSSPARSQSM